MTPVLLLAATLLLASCGSAPHSPPQPAPAVSTLNGEIVGVDDVPPEQMLAQNVRITVRSGSRPVVVELGPGWYLDDHGFRFEREQVVEVHGEIDPESNVFVARRVRKGQSVVDLRDQQGQPLWPKEQPAPVSAPPAEP